MMQIKFWYTCEKLSKHRLALSNKVCYKKKLDFLKLKITLSQSISNRLVIQSSFLRSYKDIRYHYINLLRSNFLKTKFNESKIYNWDSFYTKEFLLTYSQHKAMNDLDYALFWKGSQINSLFNIKTQTTRKRKKNYHQHNVYFISGYKRLLFVWRWLCASIRCFYVKDTPRKFSLIPGLNHFLLEKNKNDLVYKYKLHVYRLKLIRVS
jgi:hypothetical protein